MNATPTPAPAPRRDPAREILARMSLAQKVGQVFMLGFEGTSLDERNRALVHDLHLGGVTLFGRNIESPRQVAALVEELQAIADPVPLFVSIDQEGGLVVRITKGATVFPGAMALGATGEPELARRVADAQARELLAMGINMNLAPVVDVNTNSQNPVIGVRAFGSQVEAVSRFGVATVEGHQQAGVSAVAKHFPGHGDTAVDSHFDLPVVPHTLDRLEAAELPPFAAAMRAGADAVMTAHVYLPAIEPQTDVPATLSRAVLTGLLREKLGYNGLILTDALDMKAITRDRSAAEAAVEAFEAGADVLLIAGITREDRARLAEGPKALLAAVRSGRVSTERLEQSVLRVLEAKLRRGIIPGQGHDPRPIAPDLSLVGSAEHRLLAYEAARKAITLVRDEAGALPLSAKQRVLVLQPDHPTRSIGEDRAGEVGSLAEALRRVAPGTIEVPVAHAPSPSQIAQVARQAADADVVVLATYDAAQQPAQLALARALHATGKPLVLVTLRGPYDASALPFAPTVLAAYGDRPVHLRAAAEALVGAVEPAGTLPVKLP